MAARPVYIFIGAWLWLLYKLFQSVDTRLKLNHWLRPSDTALVSIPVSVPLALFFALPIAAVMPKLLAGQRGCLPSRVNHWFIRLPVTIVLCAIFIKVVQMAESELGGSLNGPVSNIVSSGVFAVSRNPVYLSGLIVWPLAMSVGVDSIMSGLLLFFLMWSYISLVVIPAEEKYLTSQFPEEFEEYAMQTPRWIRLN